MQMSQGDFQWMEDDDSAVSSTMGRGVNLTQHGVNLYVLDKHRGQSEEWRSGSGVGYGLWRLKPESDI